MDPKEEVKNALRELKPKLEELAEGYAEFEDIDIKKGMVKVKLIGGKLM
ncbi:MAG TPA: hypothetical protein PLM71_04715 [Syntrophorhabdaceae bacterium]|nr:hypothetical protein [Syntrophorhabdaceae bacterium]HPU29605.1 hypothetical protein [Syntrophorhabdaceae bacterium]